MADITKCCSDNCNMKDKCYRYQVEPNELWQSYCDFLLHLNIKNCSEYIPMEKEKNETKT